MRVPPGAVCGKVGGVHLLRFPALQILIEPGPLSLDVLFRLVAIE